MKVLLVVDVQNGFMKNDKYKELSNKIDQYIAKSNYDKIIFTKFINDKLKNPLYQDRMSWGKLTTEAQQEFSVKVPSNAIVMEKYGYGLTRENLDYMDSLKVNEIDVCGLESEACVYAVALQLWGHGNLSKHIGQIYRGGFWYEGNFY